MDVPNKSLVLDLLEWLAPKPRPYREVMLAWRTHCPRLTIWEDALDLGLVARSYLSPAGEIVEITGSGRVFLEVEGRAFAPPSFPPDRPPQADGRRETVC